MSLKFSFAAFVNLSYHFFSANLLYLNEIVTGTGTSKNSLSLHFNRHSDACHFIRLFSKCLFFDVQHSRNDNFRSCGPMREPTWSVGICGFEIHNFHDFFEDVGLVCPPKDISESVLRFHRWALLFNSPDVPEPDEKFLNTQNPEFVNVKNQSDSSADHTVNLLSFFVGLILFPMLV